MASLQGQFLIASEDLLDPNFRQAVVLLVQHSEQGAMGVVVNRPTTTGVREAWEKIAGTECEADGVMHIGGPCEGALSVLHVHDEWSDIEVLEGLHFTASKDSIEQLVEIPHGEMRFFIGYSGWGPGQLENELRRGDWSLYPAKPEILFSAQDEMWETLRKRSAGMSVLAAMKIRYVPDDPSLN